MYARKEAVVMWAMCACVCPLACICVHNFDFGTDATMRARLLLFLFYFKEKIDVVSCLVATLPFLRLCVNNLKGQLDKTPSNLDGGKEKERPALFYPSTCVASILYTSHLSIPLNFLWISWKKRAIRMIPVTFIVYPQHQFELIQHWWAVKGINKCTFYG